MMPRMPSNISTDLTIRPRSSTDESDVHLAPSIPDAVRVRNRRKAYLDSHPEYFGPELELADPLLYDRLVRRFQSPAEREAEGRKKGYSGVLEADLYRSEAKMDALRHPDPNSTFTYKRGMNGEILAEDKADVPANREEGNARWKWEMEARFIRGGDDDFDYKGVDENEDYDDHALERREAEEEYFDSEKPEFVSGEDGVRKTESKELVGETGVQDF